MKKSLLFVVIFFLTTFVLVGQNKEVWYPEYDKYCNTGYVRWEWLGTEDFKYIEVVDSLDSAREIDFVPKEYMYTLRISVSEKDKQIWIFDGTIFMDYCFDSFQKCINYFYEKELNLNPRIIIE